jgi:hypothetical protein
MLPQKLALLLAIIIAIVFGHNWVKHNDKDTIEDIAEDLAAGVDAIIKRSPKPEDESNRGNDAKRPSPAGRGGQDSRW